MNRRRFLQSAFASAFLGAGKLRSQMASRGVRPSARPKFSGRPFPVTFTDVARPAGLTEPIPYGEPDRKRYIFEANGPGIAFFDYEPDGWLDIFVLGGTRLEGGKQPRGTNRLYRNNRDGTFTDVTEKAGLVREGWGYGVCIGDYDNDGYDDLFLTYYGENVLYHNNGDGTFTDVSDKAGLRQGGPRFSTGCAFVDYDRDGKLDLFLTHYIDLDRSKTPEGGKSRNCKFKDVMVNCGPLGLPKEFCSLYHNNGDGTFADVTRKAGLLSPGGRYGLGAIAFDYDNDGWPDLFVACDSSFNLLFRNNRDGTFREVGVAAGVAVNQDGREQANMGVAAGDYDGDGYPDLFLPHFFDDTPILYHNEAGKFFEDVTEASGLAVNTHLVGWGTGFADFDNDGWLDLFQVSGSVYPEVEKIHPNYPLKMLRTVYRNLGNGTFEEVSELCGAAIQERHCSRGCAFGDFNNDGKIDVLVMNMSEPPSLLRNDAASDNHWLMVKVEGTRSNRSGIGARVVVVAGGRRQIREVMSGSSYLSQSDLRQHFGLGREAGVDLLQVHWPSGVVATARNISANQFVTVREGTGLLGIS